MDHSSRVCAGAPGGELDHTMAKPSRLALGSQEPASNVDHDVVPMVGAVRDQHPMASFDQLSEMIASLRSPTSTGWRLSSLGAVSSERMFG
jgi:hypothetical protein